MEFTQLVPSDIVSTLPSGNENEGVVCAAQDAWKPEKPAAAEKAKVGDQTANNIAGLIKGNEFLTKDNNGQVCLSNKAVSAIEKYMAAGNNSSPRAQELQTLLDKWGIDAGLNYTAYHIKNGKVVPNTITNLPGRGGNPLQLTIEVSPINTVHSSISRPR